MEIGDEPLADDEIGPQLTAGRDNAIYAVGTDKVLRRAPDRNRSFAAEARVMAYMAAHGYPVPQVHRVGPGEMVLERVSGPTMLDDLGRRPWRLRRHARTLADLHDRLHRITPPDDLPAGPVPGDAVLHLDLHPQNVILSPAGPVLLDWTNASRGAAAADVAMTWIIMAVSEVDDAGVTAPFIALFRRRFVELFLAAAGRDAARAVLGPVATYRTSDRNVRSGERVAVHRLVEHEGV